MEAEINEEMSDLRAEVERLRAALRDIRDRTQIRYDGMGVHSPRDDHMAADERARLRRAIDEALNPVDSP